VKIWIGLEVDVLPMDHETQDTGRCMIVSKNWTWEKKRI